MEQGEAAPASAPRVALDILLTIRTAQSQHGLRHSDYGRYRQYCTRRLRRLYRATKFLHGRNRYVKKRLEPDMITDARFLAIPLVSAERSWAAAMEIKGQLAAGPEAPKRRHLQNCLWRAATWSAELARLAAARGDSRTGLEAEAYASWLRGSALLEKEADWEAALSALTRAKKLWGELAKVGGFEAQAAARAQLGEVEPAIRYCSYRLGRVDGAELVADPSNSTNMLGDRVAALAAEQQASASAETSSFTWRGTAYELPNEATRVALHKAAQLAAQLDELSASAAPVEAGDAGAAGAAGPDERLAVLDKLAGAYDTARAAVTEAISADIGGKVDLWRSLETAVRGAATETALRKTAAQTAAARARFGRSLAKSLVRSPAGGKSKDKERVGRPEDVVRLCDTRSALVAELSDVAAALGGVDGERLLDATAAQAAVCQAGRCYFLAHTHLTAGRQHEAAALFQRAMDHIQTAVERHQDCEQPDKAALAELAQLRVSAAAFRIAAHAGVITAQERMASGVAEMTLDGEGAANGQQGYLADSLAEARSYAGGPGGKDARIAPLVPALQAIPVRPIVLDSAREFILAPSLDHRFEKAPAARSLTSRLFGWS